MTPARTRRARWTKIQAGSPTEAHELTGAPTIPDTALAEERLYAQARPFLRASKAPSTLRAYRSDWQHFVMWCPSPYSEYRLRKISCHGYSKCNMND